MLLNIEAPIFLQECKTYLHIINRLGFNGGVMSSSRLMNYQQSADDEKNILDLISMCASGENYPISSSALGVTRVSVRLSTIIGGHLWWPDGSLSARGTRHAIHTGLVLVGQRTALARCPQTHIYGGGRYGTFKCGRAMLRTNRPPRPEWYHGLTENQERGYQRPNYPPFSIFDTLTTLKFLTSKTLVTPLVFQVSLGGGDCIPSVRIGKPNPSVLCVAFRACLK
uniref:SFRICE_022643 n=1 Tax=Spodoptera frugiperda TaxID=7108 RepID=A0A2H1W0K2_SPOFR